MCPEPFDKLRTAPVEGRTTLLHFDKLSAHGMSKSAAPAALRQAQRAWRGP